MLVSKEAIRAFEQNLFLTFFNFVNEEDQKMSDILRALDNRFPSFLRKLLESGCNVIDRLDEKFCGSLTIFKPDSLRIKKALRAWLGEWNTRT